MVDTDPLGQVEIASRTRIEADSLIDAASKSLQLIEPWNTATSEHPTLVNLIKDVKEQGLVYYKALDMSIATAQDGYTFCSDAEFMCDTLLDPNTTTEEIQEFIQDMRAIARRAHGDATRISELFRSVLQNLNEITKGIPAAVSKLQEQEQHARELKVVAERASERARGQSTALFPWFIWLPRILPFLFPFGLGTETRHNREAARRDTEARSYADAMAELERATTDLSALVQHVDLFASWWLDMDTMLGAVEYKVDQLRAERLSRLRISSIKKGWSEIKHTYMRYKTRISVLQYYYPSSRPILSPRLIGNTT